MKLLNFFVKNKTLFYVLEVDRLLLLFFIMINLIFKLINCRAFILQPIY